MNIPISISYPKTAICLGLEHLRSRSDRGYHYPNVLDTNALNNAIRKGQYNHEYHNVLMMDTLCCLVLAAFLDIDTKRIRPSGVFNDLRCGTDAICSTGNSAKQIFDLAIDFTTSNQFIEQKIQHTDPSDGTKMINLSQGEKLVPVAHVVIYITTALIERVLRHLENDVFNNLDPRIPTRNSLKMAIRNQVLSTLYAKDLMPDHIIRLHTGIHHPHKKIFKEMFMRALGDLSNIPT